MTEVERQEYWDAKNYIFDNIHNLPGESPDVMRLRFDAALANKGILLDASLRLRSIIEHSGDSALIRDFAGSATCCAVSATERLLKASTVSPAACSSGPRLSAITQRAPT